MKRRISLVLCLVLVLSYLFVGCEEVKCLHVDKDGDLICDMCRREYTNPFEYMYMGSYYQSVTTSKSANTKEITATPNATMTFFCNGEKVEKNKKYNFESEPIRWRVLYKEDGKALLLSESVIDWLYYANSTVPEKYE